MRIFSTLPLILLTFLLLAFTHRSLLSHSPILRNDDQLLVEPLRAIYSPTQLLAHWKDPHSADFQPVRDLSYLLDLQIERHWAYPSFHLQNILLWSLVIGIFYQLAGLYFGPSPLLWVCCLIWAIHPAFAMSTAWISGRKHLWAALFILLATRSFLRGKLLKSGIAYLLAILSQPIVIAWPLLALAFSKNKKPLLWFGVLVLAAGLVGWINIIKYQNFFIAEGLNARLRELSGLRSAGMSLLAWGRLWFQLLCPVNFAGDYDPYSWPNMVGIAFGFAVLFAGFIWAGRKQKWRAYLLWLLAFHLPLALVFLKIQNAFWFDTYLLLPGLLCIFPLRLVLAQSRLAYLFLLIGPFFLWQGSLVAQMRQNDLLFWRASYHAQPTCISRLNYAVESLRDKNAEGAQNLAREYFAQACTSRLSPIFFYLTTYREPKLSVGQKLEILRGIDSPDPYRRLLTSLLEAKSGQNSLAILHLEEVLAAQSQFLALLDDVERLAPDEYIQQECVVSSPFCHLLIENLSPSP